MFIKKVNFYSLSLFACLCVIGLGFFVLFCFFGIMWPISTVSHATNQLGFKQSQSLQL